MATDKKKYKVDKYKERLKDSRESYKKRKEYLASKKLRTENVDWGNDSFSVSPTSTSEENTGNAVKDPSIPNPANFPSNGKIDPKSPLVIGAGAGTGGMLLQIQPVYDYVKDAFGKTKFMGSYNNRNVRGGNTKSMHAYGRAFDISGSHEVMYKISRYCATIPGVQYVIYNREIQGPGANHPKGWRHYDGQNAHTDHVHVDFLPEFGGWKAPSSSNKNATSKGVTIQSQFTAFDDLEVLEGPEHEHEDEPFPETYETALSAYPYRPIRFRGNEIIQAPKTRQLFLLERVGWGRATDYADYESLDKTLFIHSMDYDGYIGNLYSPDAKTAFENLLLKTKKPYFEIVSGFRFSEAGQLSPHEAGCAIDILVKDIDGAREIADCAWLLGFRSIMIGGDFKQEKGFIHIDIAPKGTDFSYDGIPIYGGPGKWVYA